MVNSYFYPYVLCRMFADMEVSVDVVALLTIGVAAVTYTYQKVIKPSFVWSKSMVESLSKIDSIHEQMFTNGGKTLRDAVNRIENRMTLLENQQAIYIMDTPHAIFRTSSDGGVVFVNRTMCRITGKTERELLGHGWINSVADSERERVDDLWRYSIQHHIEFSTSFDMTDTDGRVFKVKCIANPMKSSDSKVIGYMGIIDVNG